MSRIRNIIFDLDGTLIDSSEGVVAAVNYSLERMGEPPQPAERIKTYIGYPLSRMYPDFTDKPVAELCAHFQVKAAETVISSTVALEGVDQTLRTLHGAGYQLGIATTKIKKHLDGIIQLLNWTDMFVAAIGGDQVERVKPDPMPFQAALRAMDAVPGATIVVGDTENDILAAKAVPLFSVAVRSPYGDDLRLREAGPDHFINHLADLPGLLDQLNRNAS